MARNTFRENVTLGIETAGPSTPQSQSPVEIANSTFSKHYANLPKPLRTRSGDLKTPMTPTASDAFEAVTHFAATQKTVEEFDEKLREALSRNASRPSHCAMPIEASVSDITIQRNLAITRRNTAGYDANVAVSRVSVDLQALSESDQKQMEGGLAELQLWLITKGTQKSEQSSGS